MSYLPKEARPKLIPKRGSKFELLSSDHKVKKIFDNVPRQGSKRINTEDDGRDLIKPKRICTTSSTAVPPPTKNLANNRLKRLKEQIQASANKTQTEASVSKDTFVRNNDRNSKSASITLPVSNVSKDTFVRNNERNNKSTSITLPISNKKNIAAKRLQKLKRKLSFNDNDAKLSASSCDKLELRNVSSNLSSKNIDNENTINTVNVCHNNMTDNSTIYQKNLSGKYIEERTLLENYNMKENKYKTNISTFNISPLNIPIEEKKSYISDSNSKCNTSFQMPEDGPNKQGYEESNNYRGIAERLIISNDQQNHKSDGNATQFLNNMKMTTSDIESKQMSGNNSYSLLNKSTNNSLNESYQERSLPQLIDDESENMEWMDSSESINEPLNEDRNQKEVKKDPEKLKDICIVVDTNVFIAALPKIRDILNFKSTGPIKPIIYIPWMVITELDYMKDSSSNSNSRIANGINNAVKFINNALNCKHEQIVGQTVFEVEKQKYIGPSPDDKIIGCCLQAAEKYDTVILLSNDVNLKSRAMINNITCCSSNEILIKIVSKLTKNTKTQKIMHKLGIMCSSIICDCMKEIYGDVWTKMDLMRCPPWSLLECLKRFKKYWTTVFRDKLMKQFVKTVQGFQDLLEANKYFSDDSDEFIEFMKLSVATCVYLKDIEECRGFIENTLAEITKIAD